MSEEQFKKTIESLYSTFSKYSPSDMYHCTCGCIDEEDVKKLASKPLRQLGYDELVSYQGSALYTWGGPEHYKHFLPRILELHTLCQNSLCIELREVLVTLEYAQWKQWPTEEQEAIKRFVRADWQYQINDVEKQSYEIDWSDFDEFLGFEELLMLWNVNESRSGLKNFVHHFHHQGNALLDTKSSSEFLRRLKVFVQFIERNQLVETLEDEFFKTESQDPEYAEHVSAVQQMIEQHLMLHSTSKTL